MEVTLLILIPGYGGIIAAGEVTPILPVAGEKQPDNITKFFFDALLQFIVSEVGLLCMWEGGVGLGGVGNSYSTSSWRETA